MISTLASALIDGLALSMLYFMIASGFSLIFGLEGIVNFAHGSLFMLGAFVSYEVVSYTGSFYFGLLAAGLSMAIIGAIIESGLLRRKFGNETAIIMTTLGIMYVIHYGALIRYGAASSTYRKIPTYLRGTLKPGGIILNNYQLFIIVLGLIIAGAVFLFLNKTNVGLIVRAGIDDVDMAKALGANTRRTFTLVFAIGSALAGLGGAASVGWIYTSVDLGLSYLFFAFAIVVIGGLGSFKGTFYSALLAGVTHELFAYFLPFLAGPSLFILMAAILLLKPEGLAGGAKP